jgi:ABC-type Fe3+-hydroxamate transport system substrate-binding protein
MPSFTDQMQRTIELDTFPKRIVSLVPSQTELLYDLGLEEEVIGITKFCIHPENWFRTKKRVGGTKQINRESIDALKPDLIIGNKEENERIQIESLTEAYPVWMSDIETLDDALDMMRSVGKITNREAKANQFADEIKNRFQQIESLKNQFPVKRTAYFIWRNPWMAAGKDTFINHLLTWCKFENVFTHEASRYPEITNEMLRTANPELILLSSEPYPFKEKHINELQTLLPQAKIELVDGELFSWYGTRLLHTPQYLEALRKKVDSLF